MMIFCFAFYQSSVLKNLKIKIRITYIFHFSQFNYDVMSKMKYHLPVLNDWVERNLTQEAME